MAASKPGMTTRNFVWILLASVLVAAGCANGGTDDGGEIAQLPQGLTVLDAQEGSLSLAYRRADVVIYLDARRGHEAPEAYRTEPSSPRYEVDARFTDDRGFVFYSQLGGDQWVDAEWAEQLQRQTEARAPSASNEILFRLAGEAAGVMRPVIEAQLGAQLASALEPEVAAIHTFAAQAPAVYAEQLQRMQSRREQSGLPLLPGPSGDVTYGTDGPEDASYSYGAGYYYIAVHDQSISYTFGLGRHSSTALYNWVNGWVHVHNACNHGACGTAMPIKCLLQYYEAAPDYRPAWTLRTCSTEYDFDSDGGGHNCHDDTRVQMHNFVYASAVSGNQYWCNGSDDSSDISSGLWPFPNDQDGSPDCNARSDKGYHHPGMCDYTWNSSCPASWQGTADGCDCGCAFPDGTGADPDCA